MILAVYVLVMLWQVVVVHGIRPDVNWTRNWMGGTVERGLRRAIEDGDDEDRYLDDPEAGVGQDRSNGGTRLIQAEESQGASAYSSSLLR
jgi:hypothetical protein